MSEAKFKLFLRDGFSGLEHQLTLHVVCVCEDENNIRISTSSTPNLDVIFTKRLPLGEPKE